MHEMAAGRTPFRPALPRAHKTAMHKHTHANTPRNKELKMNIKYTK